ncbi:Serine/threonine-protein kinase PrkC [Faecalibacterium prausnitzii]|uniref:non-specific serine/threonine protein kinase n=1 Tax=Faecalibacterium hattorii TaxID=2935520 RepID=A0A173WA87_9FIRM|nr:Stk1 family PASTA domain-containing Ser/Thr kinase [Faecalibacterium hattorii]RAW63177.1 Stk1 family PASTA domain-containing Ser/Thr kinase [Faecalibacterium hattorii]CUN35940.1 Serine/threonine-protein kinase PrkC [Faecalibacterium prausnitzii]
MDNLIGKTLDGLYTVRELIGTGGMANVYKAVVGPGGPVPEGTVVAVKVLRQELMHDPDLVRRFKNESKAISLLNHPNIVKVYDVSVSENLQYIVMEYVDGMTLREYLNERGGKLTSRETVHFISQILKALDHAHRNGVVHRDIKPQNIMLLDNGQLRMMDFGIARISRAENQLTGGKAMGSVHYISPEQAKGDETDFTSDIYSVGVMMYEMLSGHLPFDADDVVEVAIKQISDKPQSLQELAPNVPHGLVEITERAMAKRPDNRYASAAEMLNALNAYVENPAIVFNYTYLPDEIPEKVVERPMKTQKDAPEPKKARKGKKKRTVFLPVLFGITVAFALACLALCWAILNDSSTLMSEKADVVLADYSGMTQDEVNAQPQVSSGQITVNWEQSYSNDYAAGYVYKQSPVAGRTVREGQSVTLTVSLGIQSVTVPDVTNYLQADAEQQLKNLGVSVLVTQAVEPTVASGSVIRTDPAAGSQVAAGSTVVVYVSRPQVSTTAKVPSLVGLSSVNDARTLLVQNKLGLGSTTEQYSDKPAGTIIGQNPAAGSTVKVNSRVSVTVSAGPEPEPEVPEEPASSAESSDSASSSGDWWSGLVGGSSSSGSSSTGSSPLTDWWTSLLS